MVSCIILGPSCLTLKNICGSLSLSKYLLKANYSLASSCKLGNALLASNNRSLPKSAQNFLFSPLSPLELYIIQLSLTRHLKSLAQGFLGGCVRLLGLMRQLTMHHVCLSHQSNSQPKDLIIVSPFINSR